MNHRSIPTVHGPYSEAEILDIYLVCIDVH